MTPRDSGPPADICLCRTDFDSDTTTLCLHVEDHEAALTQEWAMRLGVDRGQLLRDALRCYLAALAAAER